MQRDLFSAAVLFLLLTAITGIVYPGVVTGVAQIAFREPANGSLIVRDGKPIGSALIGQPFSDPKHFWSRPSATGPQPYNGLASSGSNLGPTNPALVDTVKGRVSALRAADPQNARPIPQDLVTASASGLDPHISPAAAEYQLPRVASARGIDEASLRALLVQHTQERQLGVLGERRVNVLQLNLALDAMKR
jgi:potassium-transporting ATPase KdpC subunit